MLLLKSLSLIPFDMFRKISASKFPMGVTCLEERPRDHLGVLLNKSCITTSLHSTLESELTNLDSILKSRNITLTTKVHLVKAMVFLVVMYGCESWIIKKTECRRIDAFELWCWRRLLRVPWTARRLNQSIIKEINPEYSLEGLMLKLQYFGHLMWTADSLKRLWCWGRLKAGGEGGNRGWGGWMASPTQWTWIWACSRRYWRTGRPGVLQSLGLQSRTWLSD